MDPTAKANIHLAFVGKVKTRWLRTIVLNVVRERIHKNRIWSAASELSDADGAVDSGLGVARLSVDEFVSAACQAEVPPHQFIVATGDYVLLIPHREIVTRYGQTPLDGLVNEWAESVQTDTRAKFLAYLRPLLDLPVSSVIKSPATRKTCAHVL